MLSQAELVIYRSASEGCFERQQKEQYDDEQENTNTSYLATVQ